VTLGFGGGANEKFRGAAAGIEPARGFPQRIFVPATTFAAAATDGVCRLDYTFVLGSDRKCCPSSLYTFPFELGSDLQSSPLPVPGFLLLSVAHFTRPLTPTRDRMDEHKRRGIGLKGQRLIVGFKRRHIDQRSHAILAGGDLAASD
jgi:hypothetical protein